MEEVKVESGTPAEVNVPETSPVEVVVQAEVAAPATEETSAPEVKPEEVVEEVKPEATEEVAPATTLTAPAPEVVAEVEKPAEVTEGATTSPDAQAEAA